MKFLLDTNVCIAVMRGQAPAVSRLSARAPGECAVSAVTAYELFTGAAKCREPEREHGKVMRLLSAGHVLAFDDAAARSCVRNWNPPGRCAAHTICCSQVTRSPSG